MRFHTFALSLLSGVALLGAAVAQTVTTEDGQPVIQGYGNFFRYRIDGLDPSLYDTPVVKVTQPRKFYIGEKAELTYSVQGGNRPYTFSLIGPPLPQGLTFDQRKGNFAGSSRAAAQDSYVLAVQDAKGRVAKSDPFVVAWLDDFDETQHRTYPVQAFVGGTQLPSPQPIFDGSATTDVVASGFGATVAVKFDRQIRAKTAVVAFSTEASFGACSYDLEAKDVETNDWKAVHRAQSLSSGGVLQAFNLMPSPRSGFVSDEWRVKLTNACRMRVSELRIASAAPNPPPAWQTPEGLLVAVGPVPLGVSVVAPEQSPYSNAATAFHLVDGSTLPSGFDIKSNGELTGPDGEGFPYGRVDFRLRAADGIGYWTERDYYLTPDAVPARTVYPAKVSVGGGPDMRRAMNDGVTDAGADSIQVPAGGVILFDYGRFVHVGGGTVLAGDQVGSFVLEAEAGPDSWVAPSQVAGIAKRWRLVNEGAAASVTEARLDEADYNHPPEWMTAEGPWQVGETSLTRQGWGGGVPVPTIVNDGLSLPVKADSRTIYSNAAATVALAPGFQVPAGLHVEGSSIVVDRGNDLPAGRLAVKFRAVDPLGYASERLFVFNPVAVRALTIQPSVAAPGGDVTLQMNDGLSDVSTKLTSGQALVWSFDRFVTVAADPVVSADNAAALILEAETASGWVAPATVDGIAKRWRARATATVNVSEYRLDGAPAISPPAFSPAASVRTVDQSGIDGGSDLRLPVTAGNRNPYTQSAPVISTVGAIPAGFSWTGSEIVVPKGESFPAGLVALGLKAVDGNGIESSRTYQFKPATVRAVTIAPQVRDTAGGDAYFTLYDGAADRVVHLEAGEAAVFTYPRYVLVASPNVVDATDASKIVFEAQTSTGWVATSEVGGVAKAFRARATAAVDLREYRLDGAEAPGAPSWQTAVGPYAVDQTKVAGQTGLALKVSAEVRNILASPGTIYAAQGQLPAGFSFSAANATISAPRGDVFAGGRQSVTLRASDSTGFFSDRTFAFNPSSVPAQPIKPDVRDPDGADVFGVLSDGSNATGIALADGKSVVLDYGSNYVSALRPAIVTATGGTAAIEAETAAGWVPAGDVDWIAKRFRIRAVGNVFLAEARLDGLPAQLAPIWYAGWSETVTVTNPMTVTFSAAPRSSFASTTAIAYSAPDGLPTGFTLSPGRLDTPTGEALPAGYTTIRLRATDSTGVYSDITVPLQPSAPRALEIRSTIVSPDGSNVYDIMTDGAPVATAAGVDLTVGQAVVLDYGRYVYIATDNTIEGTGTYVLEAETASGWVASNVVYHRAKRFRVKATAAGKLREARLDGLEVQGPPTWNTAGTLRTIDQSGLSLQLSASLHSRYGAPLAYAATTTLPSGFTLTSTGLLTVPPGESFPTGSVSFTVRATDAVAAFADQAFAFAPATIRASASSPDSVVDPSGGNATQTLYDDVKGTGAPGVALTSGQSVVWTFPRYVKVVPSASVVDATAPAALVVETDGGTAGWVATSSLDTGKRFRIRATAAVTVREYRLDGGAVYLPPAWTTTGGSRTVTASAIAGTSPASLSMQLQATNRSLRPADPITFQIAPASPALPAGFSLTSAGLLTVPSAPAFPAGIITFTVRAADTMGSGTDLAFTFLPEVVAMTAQLPSSVVAPDGRDVFKALYSGQNDVPVSLAPGESIVWTFPRFVSPTQQSAYAASRSGQFAFLETLAQDGSWTNIHAADSPAGGSAISASYAYGKTFRLRNFLTSTVSVTTARLGGVPSLAPVWTTPNGGPYVVSQTGYVYGGIGKVGFSLPLVGTPSTASGSTGVAYALASGATLPSGFSLGSDGTLSFPAGESFPVGYVSVPVRMTDTAGFYADRTFFMVPNSTAAATTYPSAVTAPNGSDVFPVLYDGQIDRTVAIPAGGAVTFTYPSYVSVSNAAGFALPANGSANNNLVLQLRRADGSWGAVQTYSVVSGSNLSLTQNAGFYTNIGREFRLLNSGSTGDVVLSEFRVDGAAALTPTITTSSGPWEVNQTQVVGASPVALSLQVVGSKTYSGSTNNLTFALAPTSKALPGNFGLSSSGLIVVPQGEQFPVGYVDALVRATDSRGFSVDKGMGFYPSSVAAAGVAPDTVVDDAGNDVYATLYDNGVASSVSLATNASVTYTFPRFVRLSTVSATNVGSGGNLLLERQLQDGTWTAVEQKPSSSSPSLVSSNPWVTTSKVYRLRNSGPNAVAVYEYRLDGSASRTPSWSTSAGPYFVSETNLSTSTNGPAVAGSNGLSMTVAATTQSSSSAMSYSAAPGRVLPSGVSIASNGVVTVPPASQMPSGRVDVSVRATDGHGLYADQTFSFVPSGAVRANSLPPVAVTGPTGEDLLPVLYDGRNDTSFVLKPGEAIAYTWNRFVQIAAGDFYAVSPGTNGIYVYQLQSLQGDGSWKNIGGLYYSGGYTSYVPAVADQFGKSFRIVNTSTVSNTLSEVRLDNGPSYGLAVSTSTVNRTVDTAIAGTDPAALTMRLAAVGQHPASTASTWSLRGAMPIGFTLSSDGLLTVPSGADFPFGNVAFPVRATDNIGFTGDASFGFIPSSVRAKGILPQTVMGPNGENLFRAMYDGTSATSMTLAANQSITYTFDRFVSLNEFAKLSLNNSTNYLFFEVPNQSGGWSTAWWIQNWNGTNPVGGSAVNSSNVVSKIFRVRNASANSIVVYDLPFDGADYLGPTITTATGIRTVSDTTIDGISPASLKVAMAATDNYVGAGTLSWSLTGTPPAGFSITNDGVLTVPGGTSLPYGNNTLTVRATDQGGFYQDKVFSFRPSSVAANTVAPVSVVGPSGQDLSVKLYDGSNASALTVGNDESITYTFDRYVSVSNLTVGQDGYYAELNFRFFLETPNQSGGWTNVGQLYRYNNGTAQQSGVTDFANNTSKVFRLRNVYGSAFFLSEARLDNPNSYGLTQTVSNAARMVDQSGISGASPAGFALQLGAASGYPSGGAISWDLATAVPDGFTLSSSGLVGVPAGAAFPFGSVSIPARATDAKGFASTVNYPFYPASVRANSVAPVSVTGSGGEDVFAALYDGSTSTNYVVGPSKAVTFTYDRFVKLQDFTFGTGAYNGTGAASAQYAIQVPNQSGGWTNAAYINTNGSGQFGSGFVGDATLAQSKVFRFLNTSSTASVTLVEMRLDNPASYGLTWSQTAGTYYVSDTLIAASNGGTAASGTTGLTIPLTAASGYPGTVDIAYAWAPGFTPPSGFTLSGSTLTVPASSAFPNGTISLQIRATDSRGFASLDKTFTFVPMSVRANAVAPAAIVDGSGQDVRTALYDDDASSSTTVATTISPGQSITWTYPQWVRIEDNATFLVSGSPSTTLLLERQLQDGTWQIAETKNPASGGSLNANGYGLAAPSKIWRLRNSGSVAASVIEWRLDAAGSYVPTLTTALTLRYVGTDRIVDAVGSSTASSGTSGLVLSLAGTVVSPGGGSLGYAWASGFTPPAGFALSSAGALTVPARESMPTGQAMLSVRLTDPRGFGITRVVTFAADSVSAKTQLAAATVTGPGGANVASALVDGSTATSVSLAAGESITWTFPRYVSLNEVARSVVSATTWQLEVPNQAGGWTVAETSSGLASTVAARTSRIYRLRNTGAASITVGEYAIDNFPTAGATTAWNPADMSSNTAIVNNGQDAYCTTGNWNRVRGFGGKTTGKWYFEGTTASNDVEIGLAGGNVPLTGGTAISTHADAIAIYSLYGWIRKGGSTIATYARWSSQRVMVAYDADAGRVWFGMNGTWTGDPVAGTGGFAFKPAGGVYPTGGSAFTTNAHILSLIAKSTAYAPPAGYQAWSQ